MDPLSDLIVWLAALIGIAALVGGAWLTTRTGRGWRAFAINLLIGVLSTALVVLSAGAILNKYNAWYPQWSDLWADPKPGVQANAGGDAGQVFKTDTPVTTAETRTLPPLPSPGERLQKFTVPSSSGSAGWEVDVLLPADYFEAGSAKRSYPVLVAGHGMPGAPQQWLGPLDIRTELDPLIKAKAIAAPIVVIPTLTPGGKDTECISGPQAADELERWLAKDVPDFIQAHLRAIPQRSAWAWIGFSAGGWCSAMITMLHPDRFSAAIMLGSYFRPWWPGTPPEWTKDPAKAARYDLIAMAKKAPPAVALWIQTSKGDPESWPQTRDLIAAAQAPLAITSIVDERGGHTLSAWKPHVKPALEWLGKTAPGFKPV